jgi:hypothetical protein
VETLKALAKCVALHLANAFSVSRQLLFVVPRLSRSSNLGLQLANAFGVSLIAHAFGVSLIAHAFGVSLIAHAFGVSLIAHASGVSLRLYDRFRSAFSQKA